jgi:hypothetical protein
MFRAMVLAVVFFVLIALLVDLWRWRTTLKRINTIVRLVGEPVDVAKAFLERESTQLSIAAVRDYLDDHSRPRLVVELDRLSIIGVLVWWLFRPGICEISGLLVLDVRDGRICCCRLME